MGIAKRLNSKYGKTERKPSGKSVLTADEAKVMDLLRSFCPLGTPPEPPAQFALEGVPKLKRKKKGA